MVFAARAGHRPFPAPAGRDAGTRLQAAAAPRTADRIRLALRSGACPHGRAVPDDGRDVRLRDVQALHREDAGRREKRCLAGPREALRPFVGHHVGPEQVHPGHGGVALVEPYAGHARRGDGLFGQQSEDRGFRRQDADAGRVVQPRRAQSGGRPVGHTDTRDDVLERLVPCAAYGHGAHSRLRPQGRGDLPRVRRRKHHGLCGRAVVEFGDDAPRAGIYGAAEPARSVAQPLHVRPRGRGIRSLPPLVRGADTLGADAVHGDLQRFGGLLRAGRRSVARRHAADARLRQLLRVPQRRDDRPAGGCGVRPCVRHADHLEQRFVALRNRRYGGVHLDESLPDPVRGPHTAVYQRLRRGADRRQRRPCPDRRQQRDRGRRRGVYRGAVLHVAPGAGRPRVDRGVRA